MLSRGKSAPTNDSFHQEPAPIQLHQLHLTTSKDSDPDLIYQRLSKDVKLQLKIPSFKAESFTKSKDDKNWEEKLLIH